MYTLTLTAIGNSAGVIFPKEVLAQLKIEKGDKICLTETKDGFLVTTYDPLFEKEIKAAEKIMKKYRNALRELAK